MLKETRKWVLVSACMIAALVFILVLGIREVKQTSRRIGAIEQRIQKTEQLRKKAEKTIREILSLRDQVRESRWDLYELEASHARHKHQAALGLFHLLLW